MKWSVVVVVKSYVAYLENKIKQLVGFYMLLTLNVSKVSQNSNLCHFSCFLQPKFCCNFVKSEPIFKTLSCLSVTVCRVRKQQHMFWFHKQDNLKHIMKTSKFEVLCRLCYCLDVCRLPLVCSLIYQMWVRAFQSKQFHVNVCTNNGVERQNKTLKYDYLTAYRDKSLSGLVNVLVDKFLPAAYYKLVQHS